MPRQRATERKLSQLRPMLEQARSMAIVMQDYPDPDAIAAAAALRELGNVLGGVSCTLVHGGPIGRSENRALVRYLGLNPRLFQEIDVSRFDLVAMVDTQPGTGNNSLPLCVIPHVVIDHHPIRRATRSAAFTDVRSRYGATSTILAEYLRAAGTTPDIRLATALAYGIASDTQNLGREARQADIDAYVSLYRAANKRMLSRIEHATVPRAYFRMLHRAIGNARVAGKAVLSGVGQVDNPDMIAEVADLLLRNEDSEWALCYGVHAGKLLLSLRTSDLDAEAGEVMRRLVDRIGTGGGHNAIAGGQIPLKADDDQAYREIERKLSARLLHAVGEADSQAEDLVAPTSEDV